MTNSVKRLSTFTINRTRLAGEGTVVKLSDERFKEILRWQTETGKRVSKTKVCKSVREDNLALAEFKRLRDRGEDPRAKSKTVANLLSSWLDLKEREVSRNSIQQYRYGVKHLDSLTGIEIGKLQPQRIDQHLQDKLDEGLSSRYVKLLRSISSSAYDQAIRWKLADSNPARLSAAIRQDPKRGKALNEDQARPLIEASGEDRLGAL